MPEFVSVADQGVSLQLHCSMPERGNLRILPATPDQGANCDRAVAIGWVIIDGQMPSRRMILRGVAATVAVSSFAQTTATSPQVAVIGAGAFGAWTALHLAEAGAKVTLLDAYGPGNPRATSGDESRQIRAGYGSREMYSVWALRAMELWRKRQLEFGLAHTRVCKGNTLAWGVVAGGLGAG